MKAADNSKSTKPAKAAETPAQTQSNSDLGEVKIHENVIASLVRRSALAVDGVSRLAGNALMDSIAEVVGNRRMQSRAISIEMGDNNRISIEIKLVLKFGFNIPEVASKVQKTVIEGVEKVTGTTVTNVSVIFQDIEDEEKDDEEEETDGDEPEISSLPIN